MPAFHQILEKKHTGVLLPLFTMRTRKDWGIGDTASMSSWIDILRALGLDILQVLPMNEMPPGVSCPYTALSAFALDPIYISVDDIPELSSLPKIKAELASRRQRGEIRKLRLSKKVLYDEVRQLKFKALWNIYTAFHQEHILKNTALAGEFFKFNKANENWLDDYAVFRRLKDLHNWSSWTGWEGHLKDHSRETVLAAHSREELQILFFKYLQWTIHRQWANVKQKASVSGIKLFGDLPFMVNQESADVWARQKEFDIHREIGAPPDAFSETGQKWGLPAYNWHAIESNGFEWWRTKVKKAEDFYDMFRIDHMVGFFRTWIIPRDISQKPDFDIKDEHGQRARGKRFLEAIYSASGMLPVAEDLGVIPPYVREVLSEMGIPGYKVMRWEKGKDGNYTEPENYPRVSLATSSTHDNEPIADWWDTVDHTERALFWKMVSGKAEHPPSIKKALSPLTRKMLKAGSSLVILPIQDIFGYKDRVNTPNTLGDHNWTYRFPSTAEDFFKDHGAAAEAFAKMIKEERK